MNFISDFLEINNIFVCVVVFVVLIWIIFRIIRVVELPENNVSFESPIEIETGQFLIVIICIILKLTGRSHYFI